MTAIATIQTECPELIHEKGFGIGLQDAAGNWRAKAALELEAQNELAYLTIAGEEFEKLQYKLIQPEINQVFDLDAAIQFKSNDHIGSVDFPYVLTMNESICKTIKFSDVIYNERYEVFPQVFQNLIKMEYTSREADANASILITDILGREILQYKLNLQKGYNSIQLDGERILMPGSYFISLNTQQKKFTKVIQKVN